MKQYQSLINYLASTVWAVHEPSFRQWEAILKSHMLEDISPEEYKARAIQARAARVQSRADARANANAAPKNKQVAVYEFAGPIINKATLFSDISGGISPEGFERDMAELKANDDVAQVLYEIDSGGGAAIAMPQLDAVVKDLAEAKDVAFVVNGIQASAALGAMSSVPERYTDAGAVVGSIGALMVHSFFPTEHKQTTIVRSADLKSSFNRDEPLSDDGLAQMNRLVMSAHDQFVNLLDTNFADLSRAQVEALATGEVWTGQQAVDQNLGLYHGVKSLRQATADAVAEVSSTQVVLNADMLRGGDLRINLTLPDGEISETEIPISTLDNSSLETLVTSIGDNNLISGLRQPLSPSLDLPDLGTNPIRDYQQRTETTTGNIEGVSTSFANESEGSEEKMDAHKLKAEHPELFAEVTAMGETKVFKMFNLGPEESNQAGASALCAQAVDGVTYRAELLADLEAQYIRAYGNDEGPAAQSERRVYAEAAVGDIKTKVDSLKKLGDSVAGKKKSKDPEPDALEAQPVPVGTWG